MGLWGISHKYNLLTVKRDHSYDSIRDNLNKTFSSIHDARLILDCLRVYGIIAEIKKVESDSYGDERTLYKVVEKSKYIEPVEQETVDREGDNICDDVEDHYLTISDLHSEFGDKANWCCDKLSGKKRIFYINRTDREVIVSNGKRMVGVSAEDFCEKFTRSDYSEFIVGEE